MISFRQLMGQRRLRCVLIGILWMSAGPSAFAETYYVDSRDGKDDAPGTKASPWRTLRHAVGQLKPGDTLLLRGGVYFEKLTIALAGRSDAPITIRSTPGEQAILDGGWREFLEAPATAWEPFPQGAPGEYRSTRTYPNARDVLGSFAESKIGLQTYHHVKDLRAVQETVEWEDEKRPAETDIRPLYCGPGVWYDRETGRIHIRLAHTHLPVPLPNYQEERDPRKTPLILAPFRATPLHLDGAQHVRIQDISVRGGGYNTIVMDQASHVTLDNITVWAGTYGLRAEGTVHLKLWNCGFHGNVAPWTFRSDTSKRDYPGRPHRNLTRLNTHALIEIDNGGESSVYATPQNDHWEIGHCEFSRAHDGVYIGGMHIRFHHNRIDDLQDDGIYLSPMYFRHRLDKNDPQIHIYQNIIRGALTALAFGGTEAVTRDRVFVYRNLFDLRGRIPLGRPSAKQPVPVLGSGHVIGDHGSPPWSALNIYHNTFIQAAPARHVGLGTFGNTKGGHPRRIFNNIFYHGAALPAYDGPDPATNVVADGNLYWSAKLPALAGDGFFKKYRTSKAFAEGKSLYPVGSSTNSLCANPEWAREVRGDEVWDPRLKKGSPAIDAGVDIPRDWPDPLRETDGGRPDIGALPAQGVMFSAGREGK